jgi:hypothetical protein
MSLDDAAWRKATRSSNNGGNCVEVVVAWRKATRSSNNGGDCVEVAVVDAK